MPTSNRISLNKLVPAKVSLKFMSKFVDALVNNYDLSIALVSANTIRKLNQRYRKINHVTDVLSFAYASNQGELIICYSQIKKQAQTHGISIKLELARMLVHGILHLQGALDDTEAQAEAMHIKENEILKHVKF